MDPMVSFPKQEFMEETKQMERSSGKTLASRIRDCVFSLVISAICAVLLFLIVWGSKADGFTFSGLGIFNLVLIALVILTFATLVISPIMMLYYACKSKKTVTCPFCAKSHRVFSDVSSCVCGDCGRMLLLKKYAEAPGSVIVARCPVCRFEFGAQENYGETRCNACGAALNINVA